MVRTRDSTETRGKFLAAATDVIRAKGYTATTVDDICAAAGLTKGSFFHHFESKEQLGIAAVEQFNAMATELFGSAPYQAKDDPRDRIFGYIDLRIALLTGEISQYTCLIGTTGGLRNASGAARDLRPHAVRPRRDADPRSCRGEEALRARCILGAGERRLFHAMRAARRLHLRQSAAEPESRGCKPWPLAGLSGDPSRA
jgi:AcrR family transcriptional regulator